MIKTKAGLAALGMMASLIGGQAVADEYHLNLTSLGKATAVGIGNVNTPLAAKHSRVVHGLVITNNGGSAVTATFLKLPAGSTAAVTQSVVIVPQNSSQVVTLQSGMPFLHTQHSGMDDLEVELTSSGSAANVDLTLDYQDVGS